MDLGTRHWLCDTGNMHDHYLRGFIIILEFLIEIIHDLHLFIFIFIPYKLQVS